MEAMAEMEDKPFLTNARYFSDFIRDPEWFYGI
jgi:hypothetical protein